MKIQRWSVYSVDLKPRLGTKPGKIRPCVVVQDDSLNSIGHPSTVILPISSKDTNQGAFPLRIFLPKGEGGLQKDSVVLVDQFLAYDNRCFKQFLGELSLEKRLELEKACRSFFGWI